MFWSTLLMKPTGVHIYTKRCLMYYRIWTMLLVVFGECLCVNQNPTQYKVWQFKIRNGCSLSLGVESGKLMYPSMFGHAPTCVYMSHRPNELLVPKQYMSVVYRWRKNEWQDSGAADKHQVLCEDWYLEQHGNSTEWTLRIWTSLMFPDKA
jgi:hypothetical protein